jgi:hypothetical protein
VHAIVWSDLIFRFVNALESHISTLVTISFEIRLNRELWGTSSWKGTQSLLLASPT